MGEATGFLDSLTVEARAMILRRSRRRRFARREVIFHQGDPAESLHVVDNGWVAIKASTTLGDVATLDLIGAGAVFGELSLLPGADKHRSATVVAIEPSQTIEISQQVFDDLCRNYPDAVDWVLGLVGRTGRRATERLVEALYVPVETRLVRRLLDARDMYRPQGPVPLTQDDLASLAGTTRETANRVLRRLVEAGAITVGRGSFDIADRALLERRARA